MLPVAGDVIDGYDFLVALCRGEYAEAGIIAGMAALPGSGRLLRGVGDEVVVGIARNFDDLASLRRGLGLPPAGSHNDVYTLARLDINGQSFYGINAHGQPITLNRVNPITQTHAEADAVQQAINAGLGKPGGQVTMYVDRPPCMACGRNNGIGALARNLGVDQIELVWPGGKQIFTPTQ